MEHSRYRPVPGFKWKRIRGKESTISLVRIAALIAIGRSPIWLQQRNVAHVICLRKMFLYRANYSRVEGNS